MTPGWKGAFPALGGAESGGMVSLGMFNLHSAMEGGEKEESNHRVISPARSQERITPSFSQSRQRAGLPPGPHSGGLLPGRGFRSRPGGISIMRHSWFHGWGGKVHPASFCGDPVGPLRTALSRPMLLALIALNPRPQLGNLKSEGGQAILSPPRSVPSPRKGLF